MAVDLLPATLRFHAAATWAMIGLIWFVQVVHYPLFLDAGRDGFLAYATNHQRLTTWVVLPLMTAELASAGWLVWSLPAGPPRRWAWAGLLLLGVIWASTAFLQVPLHGRLLEGWDEGVIRRLVATNWLRTVAWTARGWIAWRILG